MIRGALQAGLGLLFLAIMPWPASGQIHSVPASPREHEAMQTDVQGVIRDSLRLLIMEPSEKPARAAVGLVIDPADVLSMDSADGPARKPDA